MSTSQCERVLWSLALCALAACNAGKDDPLVLSPDARAPCLAAPERCSTAVGVFTLSGYAPTLPPEELEPIADILGDAEVVGLGESAHASAGFIGLKIRLSRELIEDHGFRVVAWESSRVPARELDAYVQTCSGDPGDAVKKLYEIWADVQTRDFARWLCEWNRAHPDDRVQVHGVDVQDPESDRAELEAFLNAAAPAQAPKLLGRLAACERRQYEACRSAVAAVRRELERMSAATRQAAPDRALATARIALTSYAAWQDEVMIEGYAKSFEARDIGMAEVFLQLRDLHFPGQKALLWAHNIHVIKRHETVSESWVGGPIVTQGTELDRRLGGDRYRAIAMIGRDVWLNRPEQRGRAVPAASATSLEAVLDELGGPALFLDLRHPNATAVVRPNRAIEVGAPGIETHVPAENYDGVFFLEKSPMAEVL